MTVTCALGSAVVGLTS